MDCNLLLIMSLWGLLSLSLLLVLSFSETLYELLEIEPSATEFEIKKAFRKLSTKYNSDYVDIIPIKTQGTPRFTKGTWRLGGPIRYLVIPPKE